MLSRKVMKITNDKKEYEYWGKVARQYDAAIGYIIEEETQRETGEWVSGQFSETDHILEMGCGTGVFSSLIARKKVGSLTATDGSPAMVELARTRLRASDNVRVLLEDCYHTSFPDGSFDGIFLGNLLHILRSPTDTLKECLRLLRDNGSLVVVDATSSGMPLRSRIAMGIRYLKMFGLPPRENRIMTPDDITRMLEHGGFIVEESRLIEKETNMICLKGRKRK